MGVVVGNLSHLPAEDGTLLGQGLRVWDTPLTCRYKTTCPWALSGQGGLAEVSQVSPHP